VGGAGLTGPLGDDDSGIGPHPHHKENTLQELAYESPEILETFNAHEVMGAAEGLFSQGSHCDAPTIS
jgi:hypothetical protein